jgi:hypothetical protein
MNVRTFVYGFLGLAIFFAFLSIYLSLQRLDNPIRYGYQIYKPYGIIVMGFLSGVCFFVSGMLVKKNFDQN